MTSPDLDTDAAPAPETDAELAVRLAMQAGRGLVDLRQRMTAEGAHSWQVMDGGDTAAQRFIADELHRLRPDDPVLSEEGLEDPRRFTEDRAWIIDPLDGTREFGEPGRSDWAVHIALWADGALRRRRGEPARHRRRLRHRPGARRCRRSSASARCS